MDKLYMTLQATAAVSALVLTVCFLWDFIEMQQNKRRCLDAGSKMKQLTKELQEFSEKLKRDLEAARKRRIRQQNHKEILRRHKIFVSGNWSR